MTFFSQISFRGFKPAAIEEFLRFLYTNEPPTPENVIEVFKLAVKTDAAELIPVCENIIARTLEASNAYKIFNLGFRHSSQKLKLSSFEVIKSMFPEQQLSMDIIDDLEGIKKLFMTRGQKRKVHEDEENHKKMKVDCAESSTPKLV